ncbi:MAG: biopolymer transporter ExbD [Bdellovibrionales bacterium]|nr:biopolymer transporter ExbD [Bdellovibrionales bacterium]
MIESVLKQTALNGNLSSVSILNPKGHSRKKEVHADLLLTALIDAFSILVIFLLMSFSSTGDILSIGKDTELPKAMLTDMLERNTLVKIEEGQIFVEDQAVTVNELVEKLVAVRKSLASSVTEDAGAALTIQADRRVQYEFLSQIVQAASHAGFGDIHFAVLVK